MGENGIAWEKMGVNSFCEIKLAILSIMGVTGSAPRFRRRHRASDSPIENSDRRLEIVSLPACGAAS
jgi:hypothetical protein